MVPAAPVQFLESRKGYPMLTIQDLVQGIPLAQVLANDEKMYRATLTIADSVPASSVQPTSYQVPPKGFFLSFAMTGRFTTLETGPADDETCKMSMKLRNGSGRVYIPEFTDMDLLLTPGRVKSPTVAAGDNGNQLQFPGIPWVGVFRGGDTLAFDVQNTAAIANTWAVAFHGIWLLK